MRQQYKKSQKFIDIHQNQRKWSGSRLHYPGIKTVQIFMKDIDSQLQRSYNKLKESKYKSSNAKKMSETILLQQNTLADYSTGQMNNTINITNFSSKNNQSDKQNITLIDNKDVLDYINYVYQIYNIRDPLAQLTEQNQGEKQIQIKNSRAQKRYSTNKKIRDFKECFQKTIGSASTLKNSYNFQQIQLSHFKSVGQRPPRNPSRNSSPFIHKGQVILLHTKNKSETNNLSNQKMFQSRAKSIKNANQIPVKRQLTIKQSANRERSSFEMHSGYVPELFRYCFMCQAPILQSNLGSHEQTCIPLKNALHNLQIPQIVRILQHKINRLKNEINTEFMIKDSRQIGKELGDIKSNVKNWMDKLPQKNKINKNNQDWRTQFDRISDCINQTFCRSFQTIYKLQWFSKIKDNLSNKYTIPS